MALLISTVLLAGLMAMSAVAVGADDEEEGSGIGMDALAGLSDGAGGDTTDGEATGNLDDPLGGSTGGTSEGTETESTDAGSGTAGGTAPTDGSTASTNPMFRLMLDLILEDVQAAEAEAKAAGTPLTDAQRSEVAARSVKDLITFLQETGILGDVDTRELLQQIDAIPAAEE